MLPSGNFVDDHYDFVEKLGFNTRGLEPYNGPSVRTEGGPVVPIAQLVLKRGAWATSKQYEHRFLVLDSDTTGVVFGWPTIRELNMFIKNPAFNGMALSTVEKGDYPNGMYELCVLTCAMGLEESRKKEYSDRRKGESKKQSDAMRASLAAQQNSLLTPWSEWILDPASQKFYHHRTNSLGIFETEWYEP
ncbi:hypothetical protein DL98DRAFT_649264 [Cadophora sp. DSE1049]|nr:hypothetical protein DL98DRAFT_649264 [Cadophora sp. DSE1049]